MPVSSPALAASHPCLGATEYDKEGMLGEAQVPAIGPVTSYMKSSCLPPACSAGMSQEEMVPLATILGSLGLFLLKQPDVNFQSASQSYLCSKLSAGSVLT